MTWQNPEQLFVAQVLINKVKSKCCGIKDKFIMARLDVKRFGLKATSRIKAFVFKFISVPAKWVRTSRQYVLNIYSCNNAYANVFQNDFG